MTDQLSICVKKANIDIINVLNGEFIKVYNEVIISNLTEEEKEIILSKCFQNAVNYSMYTNSEKDIQFAIEKMPNKIKILKMKYGFINEYKCFDLVFYNPKLENYIEDMKDMYF